MILFCLIGSTIGLFLMFNLTSPIDSGVYGVLVVFGLIYIFTFATLLILLRLSEVVYRLMYPNAKKTINKNVVELTNLRKNLIVATISAIPIFVISMNSIGRLSFMDLALIAIIETIAIFYIVRRTAR